MQFKFSVVAAAVLTTIVAPGVAFVPPALADGLSSMAMGTPLSAPKVSRLAGASAARLICSDDGETVTINGMQFSASALGNGVEGEISCHWFVAGGSAWTEVDRQQLADVAVKATLNFVAPSPGKEPLLYEIVGSGAPTDYGAAVRSITASYGAPQSSGATGAGPQTLWQTAKLKVIVTQRDSGSGAMQIDYLDNALEEIALRLY